MKPDRLIWPGAVWACPTCAAPGPHREAAHWPGKHLRIYACSGCARSIAVGPLAAIAVEAGVPRLTEFGFVALQIL